MIAIPIVVVLLILLYLFMIAPKNRKDMEKFKTVMYAHRGLHNNERAENSMSAFRAAVDAGYGIELDVRLSCDGQLVVFHDDTLDRVCGREGKVIDFTAEELSGFKLCGTEDGIPLFSDVLKLVDGKIPLLVEIKENAGDSSVSRATCEMLKNYTGDFIVESFNPMSLNVVKQNLPDVSRGILSHRYFEQKKFRKPLFFLLQSLLLNFICRPAFIAYEHNHAKAFGLRFVRRFFGTPTIAWTVRSAEEEQIARKNGFDGIIFENYIP
ncbi:MAG: glycerophosphodiester phosphodiesterase [Clostridia bacterium]|nr:glycerophosphodiester phosphodiesterase [Clostridia bacterium]